MSIIEEKEIREKLLKHVKKECKQLMEISVTRKCINEDNSCITSLCVAIESCLLHGLKRSALGLFKQNTTMGLLQKISKECQEAEHILKVCQEYDEAYGSNKKNMSLSKNNSFSMSSPNEESNITNLLTRKLFSSNSSIEKANKNVNSSIKNTPINTNKFSYSPTFTKGSNCHKFLWIRMAILKKSLIKIVDHILTNAEKFYLPHALIADPVDGPIFSSLLIGPCTLEFTRAKTCDYLWTDPNADELIQRHKMRSFGTLVSSNLSNLNLYNSSSQQKTLTNPSTLQSIGSISENGDPLLINTASNFLSNQSLIKNDSNYKSKLKLGLNSSIISKRKASVSVLDDISNTNNISNSLVIPNNNESCHHSPSSPLSSSGHTTTASQNTHSAKEYVESLHQNSKSQIIYGKNHVLVSHKETELAGYLSLHLNQQGLILKWTPNLLMNGSSASSLDEPTQTTSTPSSATGQSIINSHTRQKSYWDYALHIDINTIVYLHCHQQNSTGATVILVAQDGVQHPPIKFPKGSHLIQFLSCLENGLAPFGQLEPPLWNEIEKSNNRIFSQINHFKEPLKLNDEEDLVDNQNQISDENNNKRDLNFCYLDNLNHKEEEDFVFRIVNSKSNISIKPVKEKSNNSNKKLKNVQLELSMSNPSQLTTERTFFTNNKKNIATNLIHAILPHKFTTIQNTPSPPVLNNAETNQNNLKHHQIALQSVKTPNNSFNESFQSSSTPKSLKSFKFLPSTSSVESASNIGRHLDEKLASSDSSNINENKINENILKIGINSYSISPMLSNNNNYNNAYMTELNIDPIVLGSYISSSSQKSSGNLIVRSSVKSLCESMKKQILARAFYGWLLYHRHFKTVSVRLIGLINCDRDCIAEDECNSNSFELADDQFDLTHQQYQFDNISLNSEMSLDELSNDPLVKNSLPLWYLLNRKKLDETLWSKLMEENNRLLKNKTLFYKIIYYNGIESNKLRKEVWPYLLEHYSISMNEAERKAKDEKSRENYFKFMDEWKPFEQFIQVREQKKMALNKLNNHIFLQESEENLNQNNNETVGSQNRPTRPKLANKNTSSFKFNLLGNRRAMKNLANNANHDNQSLFRTDSNQSNEVFYSSDADQPNNSNSSMFSLFNKSMNLFNKLMSKNNNEDQSDNLNATIDSKNEEDQDEVNVARLLVKNVILQAQIKLNDELIMTLNQNDNDNCNKNDDESPSLSKRNSLQNKSLSNQKLIDSFALNMHRIDKDVTRCDRNYWYFVSTDNLKKLKNIIYTYVWENLNVGYIQGMCDLVAPLLVIMDDEPLVYSCFKHLMKRMSSNFPHGNAMDQHFSNMRSLIQIVDTDLFEHMHQRGDYTHFYFSYRWFLLDFKRELVYDDVFTVWETIWAAKYVSSAHFYLFVALSLIETYRDIIIDNNMDFTEIIKFFNEMAEKHDTKEILRLARNLLQQLKNLIDNKN